MIVLFEGGGPAQGGLHNINSQLTEIRVATPELLTQEEAAFYVVEETAVHGPHVWSAVARYSGVRPSKPSLVDLIVS